MESRPDPGDGRRRRVRVVDQVSAAILDAAARPIDGMIDDVIPHDVSAMQAIAMLEELAEMFLADDTNGRT